MQKKEYYCLVAGLPDLLFNENKLAFTSLNFRDELKHQLSFVDYKLVEYLFLPADNQNLINQVFCTNKTVNNRGLFSNEFLENQLRPSDEECLLPEYMIKFTNHVKKFDSKELNIETENYLHARFYEYAVQTKNDFLRNWFLFELNLRNILTAFNCIHFNYKLSTQLIKTEANSLSYSLLINKQLKPELFEDEISFSDRIFKIAKADLNQIEKEKEFDKMKWDYLNENTFFHYFTIEKILSFVLKIQICERWIKLDEESGKKLLKRLIDDLKTSYEFSEEFSLSK